MKNNIYLTLLLFLFYSGSLLAQKSDQENAHLINIKTEDGQEYIFNSNNYRIIEADSILLNINSILSKIENSNLGKQDKLMILGIVRMQSSYELKKNELKNIATTYSEVHIILIDAYLESLSELYGKKKLKKLLTKK